MPNRLMRDVIHDLVKSPSEDFRSELYRRLTQGLLYIIVERLPEDFATATKQDTALPLLTTTMPGGGVAILAFTDLESLNSYLPGGPHLVISSEEVLRAAINQGYEAIILNAAGPWAMIPREHIVKILDGSFA